MPVIEAKNVSIRYITGDLKNIGLKEYIMRRLNGEYHVQEFWADKDISFTLEKGDMMAIIGTNGAGKSTLLKAISGIMRPTKGKMKVQGTIAALLELASGFDGNMTVKENAYLRGAMLGYTRAFMDKQYANIIEFAELEDFQDTLFKQLSSGMKSRLAFAIACLVNPDIVILDEVLSVGDGSFKKKSAAKMKEILSGGVTGILVSHSISQVKEMCNKVLWLDHGRQIGFSDKVEMYCDAYEEFLKTKQLPVDEEEIEAFALVKQMQRQEELEKQARAKALVAKNKQQAKKENDALIKSLREKIITREQWLASVKASAARKQKELEHMIELRDEWLKAVKENKYKDLAYFKNALQERNKRIKELEDIIEKLQQ